MSYRTCYSVVPTVPNLKDSEHRLESESTGPGQVTAPRYPAGGVDSDSDSDGVRVTSHASLAPPGPVTVTEPEPVAGVNLLRNRDPGSGWPGFQA
jgi:hypothetical protein